MDRMLEFIAGRQVQILAAILLFASIAWPYNDFMSLAICAAAITLAWRLFEMRAISWAVAMVAITLLFNPLVPPNLHRAQWGWIDVIVALVFLACPSVRISQPDAA